MGNHRNAFARRLVLIAHELYHITLLYLNEIHMDAIERQIATAKNFQDGLFGPFEFYKRSKEGDRYDFTFCYCGKQMTCMFR